MMHFMVYLVLLCYFTEFLLVPVPCLFYLQKIRFWLRGAEHGILASFVCQVVMASQIKIGVQGMGKVAMAGVRESIVPTPN